MSRVIELIKRFVTDTGQLKSGVDSLQLSNVPRGENGHQVVRMIIPLQDGKLDQIFHNCLLSAGIYVDDIFTVSTIDGGRVTISDLAHINRDDNFKALEIAFSYEKKPITSDLIIKTLQSETIFGLPEVLFKNYPISKLKIFFGANTEPINIKKNTKELTRAYNSYPYILSFTKIYISKTF